MKKSILSGLFVVLVSNFLTAQVSLNDLKSAAPVATSAFDVSSISKQIVGYLQPTLKLTPIQVPLVTSAVTGLLNRKKSVLPSMLSDKAGYSSAMSGIQKDFPTKMGSILNKEQNTGLSKLIPTKPSATNILSKMLF